MDTGDIVFTPVHGLGLERLARGASSSEPLKAFGDPARGTMRWPQAIPGTMQFTFVDLNRVWAQTTAKRGRLSTCRRFSQF